MNLTKRVVLVTGNAGFIGMHVAIRLKNEGYHVVGLDNVNNYYSTSLKLSRLKEQGIEEISSNHIIQGSKGIDFLKTDLVDKQVVEDLFQNFKIDYVVHLAAQAGVRYSIENPQVYVDSNVTGFLNILECCRKYEIEHLIYASSSSVYGSNTKIPFCETDVTDSQVSMYASTKKANESMAQSYSSIYGLAATGLRFFTVYGPYGRPDMALFKFTKNIIEDKPIDVYNYGNLSRDFTYINDIVEGIYRLLEKKPQKSIPHSIFNIGNGKPVNLMDFIVNLETVIGKKAILNFMPMQAGDVEKTWADTSLLYEYIGYRPKIEVNRGVKEFVEWYFDYFDIK